MRNRLWILLLLSMINGNLLGNQSPAPEEEEQRSEEATPPREVVVVTAARMEQPVSDAISLVTVVSQQDLERSSALTLDDHLRRIPGFTLFRRSSSLVAHPTTQGVSLRGIGPSGTSRSLVLMDGVPLSDPFGGWVYWNRIPLLGLNSVEVARGATSQLYGSSALGGTIQLIARRPDRTIREFRGQLGSRQTYDLDFLGADTSGHWGYLASGRIFDTDGYFVVREGQRGAVDAPARVGFQTFFGRVYYRKFHAGVNLFREDRDNGTRLQQNQSRIALFETGYTAGSWQWSFHAQTNRFEGTFTRILPDRSAEFVTAEQDFPYRGVGSSLTWRHGNLVAGTDWRNVAWEGRGQNLAGVFVQKLWTAHPRLDFLTGLRYDLWENQEVQSEVNPRAGVLLRAAPWLHLRSSVYRGFRAPTLNELYRPFRVGNVETLANSNLGEERVWGGEFGGDFYPSRWSVLRLNAYWNSLRDPVGNVTLSTSPQLVLRQRQNIGRVLVQGVEAEWILRQGLAWEFQTAYLYSETSVRGTGLRLPQVPLHQGSFGAVWSGPVSLAAGLRLVGSQFEDDLNSFKLARFSAVDLTVSRSLTDRLQLFVSVENLLDEKYAVGRTPIETLGAPHLVHGGLRLKAF